LTSTYGPNQPVALENSLGNMEMVVRRQKGTKDRLFVHLVNYAGLVPRPFVNVCPQKGLKLSRRRHPGPRRAGARRRQGVRGEGDIEGRHGVFADNPRRGGGARALSVCEAIGSLRAMVSID